ncbi:MAG TPA: TniB family NTP-binding protein [Cyclobacteriaceae bacterium]|jgi:nucleoside-triphosphatase THEP1|nr:TniB family NTP-binding protein [Cyclobacteriaceae bacterium]
MKKDDNNPLLNALPNIMSKEEFFQRIAQSPALDPQAELGDRLLQLIELRHKLFIPLTFHYYFTIKMLIVMYESLTARTPADWIKSLKKVRNMKGCPNSLLVNRETVLGFPFLGISGMGKTTIVNRVFQMIPQVVDHLDFGIRQVTYLKVDCTVKGSTKQLCLSILNEFDRALGTNYFQQHGKESEERLIITVGLKAILHRLSLIVVDEVHNLENSNEIIRRKIMNFFKELTNTVGVPIIYIGTDQAAPILFGDFQTASRIQGIGMPIVDRFHEDDEEWKFVLRQLWKHQVLRAPGELTPELMMAYYRESQGILRLLIQIHCLVQDIALSNNSETIELKYFDSVKGQLIGTAPIIEALAKSDRLILSQYSDVQMTQSLMRGLKKESKKDVCGRPDDEKFLIEFAKNRWPEMDKSQLSECIKMILKDFHVLAIEKKFEKLAEAIANLNVAGTIQAQTFKKPTGDLLDVCENGASNLDNYNLLKEAGQVKTLQEILI